MVTSKRLWQWVQVEIQRLQRDGLGGLVGELARIEELHSMEAMDRYLVELDQLRQRADDHGARPFGRFLRYLVGRTRAFPLDRPGAAVEDLVHLLAELVERANPVERPLLDTTQIELIRAYHKMDSPGYREEILAGVEELWERFQGDRGPREELFDIWCRTGYFCADPEILGAALKCGASDRTGVRLTWSYWESRRLNLAGDHAAARGLIERYLGEIGLDEDPGDLWFLYNEVELAELEGKLGDVAAARQRLRSVQLRGQRSRDPMLLWDLHRVSAGLEEAAGNLPAAVAAWRCALDVVLGLGLIRLESEFALALGEAAVRARDGESIRMSVVTLEERLPRLRSAGDLRPRYEKLVRAASDL